MKVKELIKKLKTFNPENEIVIFRGTEGVKQLKEEDFDSGFIIRKMDYLNFFHIAL